MSTAATTKPVPADRDAPIAPVRSSLADVALAAGIPAADVRAFVAAPRGFLALEAC